MSFSKPARLLTYELSCPICLQLFSDPVALPCGHNYCLSCIRKASGDPTTSKVLPRCPECREEYDSTDSLQKNFKLCSIIEGYRASAPPLCGELVMFHEPEVFCDQCIEGVTPAVKTCLRCEVSLCSRHLQRHQEKESFRAHSLVEPQKELETRCCVTHNHPLEYFCSTDMTSLCATCFIEGSHQHHDILSFDVAEEEMRRALESHIKVISNRLQMTDGLLQRAADKQGASEALGDKMIHHQAVTLMDNMATLVDRYRERLNVLLEEERGQRRQSWQLGMAALEGGQQQLLEAQESARQALDETDKCLFIHRFMMIESQLREAVTGFVPTKIPTQTPLNTKRLQAGFKAQEFRSEMTRLLESLHVVLNPLQLTFNLSTAHPSLTLSNDLLTVKYSPTKQPYGENPERFTSAPQVLCTQGFSSGDHMWVVEVGGNSMWSLGLCYKSIPRRGDHSRLGHNTVSWRLQWKNKKLTACHTSSNVALGERAVQPLRIEVVLDYEGGKLEFHSTKGRREHLHTFRAVFREAVYPAFSIHSNTSDSWITLQSGM